MSNHCIYHSSEIVDRIIIIKRRQLRKKQISFDIFFISVIPKKPSFLISLGYTSVKIINIALIWDDYGACNLPQYDLIGTK